MSLPLLSEIARQGVHIRVDGDNLTVNRDKLTDSLLAKIRDKKPSLIASLERLREITGDDWPEMVKHPDQVKCLIYSIITPETRAKGDIPASYTDTVYCQTCKQSVPHFPVGGTEVGCCVWCWNDQKITINE